MAKVKKCPVCQHTWKAHSIKAHDGKGGCAYCECRKIVVKFGPTSAVLADSPHI